MNMILDWKTATEFTKAAFMAAGVPEKDAEICVDVLLEADRRGVTSHGVNRFKPIYIDRIRAGIQSPTTEFEVIEKLRLPQWWTDMTEWDKSSHISLRRLPSKKQKNTEWEWWQFVTLRTTELPVITAACVRKPEWWVLQEPTQDRL